MYREILKKNLHVSTQKLRIVDNYIFQHDNDPKHIAYNIKRCCTMYQNNFAYTSAITGSQFH